MPRKPLIAVIAAALAAAATLGLTACGSSSSSSTTTQAAAPTTAPATTPAPATTAPAPAAGATVAVAADPSGQLAFVQKTLTASAGKVTFVFTNDAPVPHNLAIKDGVTDGPTNTISGGATAKLSVDLKAGTYEFYCAVPGHEQAGMKGTLTVK